jgi:periplasmic divalent cation tolerance protein
MFVLFYHGSMSESAIVVLCTAPAADDTAAQLARGLVENRLAACVNVLPAMRSIYRWQGQIHDEGEVQLVIKTTHTRLAAIQSWLEENHPYEVPEVIALPIAAGSSTYMEWLFAQTRDVP